MQAEASSNSLEQEKIDLVDLVDQPAWKTILIDLVKSEKMDPWGIDIVDLANRYLAKIQAMEKSDLKLPANAILASAILLKLKARTIKFSSIEEDDDMEGEISEEELKLIEESVPQLRHSRQFRQGRVTLDELVGHIESILRTTKQRGNILREKDIPEFKIKLREVDIEARLDSVWNSIKEKADSQGITRFSQIIESNSPLEIVKVFLPLLFLATKGRIRVWQEEFWREIFIALQEEGKKGDKISS
ncbi:MAG: segregation/condensation protein A [Candidatus Diapherotrites archaeon]|nr:segregation/condensation protein A [Candidatus Diapherotrites archaeon]